MRTLKHLLNRPRLRALASRSANGDPVYGCRGPGEDCVALSFDDGHANARFGAHSAQGAFQGAKLVSH